MKCDQCGVCCKIFVIVLNEKEYKSGKYTTQFEEFGIFDDFAKAEYSCANIITQQDDGSCFYLKNRKCSIHNDRPDVCRVFFCDSKDKKFESMIRDIQEFKKFLNEN